MSAPNAKEGRKDRIIEAALRIFAGKGFQEATIAEISREAEVSEPTVYEHFGTKEELLFAIPEKITRDSIEEMEKILDFIQGAEARVRAILRAYIRLYQTNPDYAALALLQLSPNKRFRQTRAHGSIRRAAHILLDAIKEGVADGTFRQNVGPYLIRSMLLGCIEHMFIHWHVQGKPEEKADILNRLDAIMDIILDGVRSKRQPQDLTIHIELPATVKFQERHRAGVKRASVAPRKKETKK